MGRREAGGLIALVCALPLLLATPSAVGAATALSVAPDDPVAGEFVTLRGSLAAPGVRRVRLQRWTGDRWATLQRSTTTEAGRFRFEVRAAAPSRKFRVHVPPTLTRDGQATAALVVKTRPAEAVLAFVPAPIAQSKMGTVDLTPGRARFSPARPGRKVMLQRRVEGAWKTIATGVQNRGGHADFNARAKGGAGRLFTYRALTVRANGAPRVVSPRAQAEAAVRVFNEEFEAATLDDTTWTHRYVGIRKEKARCAEHSPSAVSVADGKAHLLVKPIDPADERFDDTADADGTCPYGQFYNGYIDTRGSFRFTYGIAAARIRFAREDGQHGGVWSQPVPVPIVPGDPAVSGAEVDVAEYFGDAFGRQRGLRNVLQNSVYWTAADGTTAKAGYYRDRSNLLGPDKTWSNSFHVFSVQWTPEQYIFRVDGRETFRTTKGVSRTDQYLILSLLTSDWELPRLDASRLNSMKVDWVRVWQR